MTTTFARRLAVLLALRCTQPVPAPAFAHDKIVKIGVLNDMSSLYADIGGPEFGGRRQHGGRGLRPAQAKGWKIEVRQRRPPEQAGRRRQHRAAMDRQSRRSMSSPTRRTPAWRSRSATSSRKRTSILLNSGAATADLTGKACNANTISYTYDTYMLANGTGKALTKAGGDTWFFLTADYAFGHALERDTSAVVTANGGKVLGGVKHPINTADFLLLPAAGAVLQGQGRRALPMPAATPPTRSSRRPNSASSHGGQKLAALLLFVNDVHALGLKIAQGLTFTESFYWDMNDQTRAWSKRFWRRSPQEHDAVDDAWPATTPCVLHYLKALDALGGNPHDGAKVVAKMKELPTDDPLFGKGPLRADGRRLIPAYLFEVKKPEESKYPRDYYKLIATISPEDAAKPLEASDCPLVKK